MDLDKTGIKLDQITGSRKDLELKIKFIIKHKLFVRTQELQSNWMSRELIRLAKLQIPSVSIKSSHQVEYHFFKLSKQLVDKSMVKIPPIENEISRLRNKAIIHALLKPEVRRERWNDDDVSMIELTESAIRVYFRRENKENGDLISIDNQSIKITHQELIQSKVNQL